MLEKASESLIHVPFLILLPFMMLATQKNHGWHRENINKNEIVYQIYVPENKENLKLPITILLKENGGKINKEEAIIIKNNAEKYNTVFIIPKNQGKWKSEDTNMLKKVVEKLDKYRNIDESKISIVSQNNGNVVATEFICNLPEKWHLEKATLINLNHISKECQNKEINLETKAKEEIAEFWKNQSKTFNKISSNSAFEYLKNN